MINRIIYFIETPLTDFDYKRYSIEVLLQNGYSVEIWDFTKLLYPSILDKLNITKLFNNKIISVFSSRFEAISSINSLTNKDLVFIHLGYSIKHYWIFRFLSKSKAYYLVTYLSNLPSNNCNKRNLMLRNILNIKKVIEKLYLKIPHKIIGIRDADFVLAAGIKSKSHDYPTGDNTDFIFAHPYEYDQYLLNKDGVLPDYIPKDYILLIDENLAFTFDYLYLNEKISINPEKYFFGINKFLNKIQNIFKKEIIIAAHPRTDTRKIEFFFGEYQVIQNKTVELIKQSYLVIGHHSMSLLFAILFFKPIMFITNNEFNETFLSSSICNFAAQLGKEPINVDEENKLNFEKEININREKYIEYVHNYVKIKNTPEILSTQILADRIKQIK